MRSTVPERRSCFSVFGGISKSRECDKKCDCRYCDDEWQCNGHRYHYWYKYCSDSRSIPSFKNCDDITDCYHSDDENNCSNAGKCVKKSSSTFIPANYSRCTPWV